MKEYIKIPNIYRREIGNNSKKLIDGAFSTPELEMLKDCVWVFTEKVDGTNIRVCWDGHRVSFAGRTDRAEIPKDLVSLLERLFGGQDNEEVFENLFADKEVILFGEGFGGRIQGTGPKYGDVQFILFDVMVGDIYLQREDIEDVASRFGVPVVPVVAVGSLADGVEYVSGHPRSTIGDLVMEGVVGRPSVELRDRRGNRIIVKIKQRDFPIPA